MPSALALYQYRNLFREKCGFKRSDSELKEYMQPGKVNSSAYWALIKVCEICRDVRHW